MYRCIGISPLTPHSPPQVTESSNILNIGATIRWHLGHTNYVFEEDDASYPIASVCEACTTLENIGEAFLGFGGIAMCLLGLVIVAIACSALGCGMFDGNGKFVLGLLNLSIFTSFLSMMLMLCGVAAMVAPEGAEYNFKVREGGAREGVRASEARLRAKRVVEGGREAR